jgi:4-amino-4-deoxy-L-arabinose transferase-like glycosyltransferase
VAEFTQIAGRRDASLKERLPIWWAIAAACVFVFLNAYRIELPGLEFDEIVFVDAAQRNPDAPWFHMKLGPVPLFVFPYMGALKAWIYMPVFRLFGTSALTIRLPVVLIAALTLLIFYSAMRGKIGAAWAAVVVWITAIDPAFPGRVDYGWVVFMHFFQAAILALWFSYRDKPKLRKIGLIFICCGLGFFDKFNFVWFIAAFVVGIFLCYPDSVKDLWISSPKLVRWMASILVLIGLSAALYLILPIMQFPSAGSLMPHVIYSWNLLQSTLSGAAMAAVTFGSTAGIIGFIPFWLTIVDGSLALLCLFLPMPDGRARENRKNGIFCLLIGLLIFVQILITPQARGPHHHSMLVPLPLLALAFLARSLYDHFRTKKISQVVALPLVAAATCILFVNIHNTMIYLSHFRSDPHYSPLWSPGIYSLSRYINEHGFESNKITCADCGVCTQLHALASKRLRRRIRDFWPVFKELPESPEDQNTLLKNIFPEGKTFVVTFDASKVSFPQTRRNFLALVSAHPELNSRLVKEFWYGSEKIYELYEVVRPPHES